MGDIADVESGRELIATCEDCEGAARSQMMPPSGGLTEGV
jgi:hypothetical protein